MNSSKTTFWIGLVLIILALSGVLFQLVSFTLSVITLVITVILLIVGVIILQAYFSVKKYRKSQSAYMRENAGSMFINITSDTADIPVTDAEVVDGGTDNA